MSAPIHRLVEERESTGSIQHYLSATERKAHIVTVTPPLVDWLLSLNTHNRNVRRAHVAELVETILRGEWVLTNQGVGVCTDGYLTDGQHRLLALREAGCPPVHLLVVTGLEPRSQVAVDRHGRRRMSDVLKLLTNRSVSDKAIAAVTVLLRAIPSEDGGGYVFSKRPTDGEIMEALADYEEEISGLLPIFSGAIRCGVAAALMEYAKMWSQKEAIEMATQVRTGEGLTSTDPSYRLRDYLSRNKASSAYVQMLRDYELSVRCCIAHARREPLKLLRTGLTWASLPRRSDAK